MSNPFKNDPFAVVWQSFKNLYPDKDCECWLDAVHDENDPNSGYGWTQFNDDGTIIVSVDFQLRLADAVEILAHELAHVAVGADDEHGEKWEKAFSAIHKEYHRVQRVQEADEEGTV